MTNRWYPYGLFTLDGLGGSSGGGDVRSGGWVHGVTRSKQ
jgi:hypothetical protein